MKYLAILVSCLFFVSTFFVLSEKNNKIDVDEVRAIYVSYIEFDDYIKGKKEDESKKNIIEILDNVKSLGLNTVIVHVRPFSDSIYESVYFPVSSSVLNDKGVYPSYDVLEFFINEAHKRNIRFEAWINPFRISNLKDISLLNDNSLYYKFYKSGNAKVTESGIYLNPASGEVQDYIIEGIKEIILNYDVDAIHFDDYFYPDKLIDLDNYNNSNENIPIDQYRLNVISSFIKNVYSEIKKTNNKVLFGIAPQGNIDNDYNDCYLDVEKILSSKGYVDYIMPQIYFGFDNQTRPFIKTLNEWNDLIKVDSIKLIPALAFYKIGTIDNYALSGKNEWINNDDIIKKQIIISRNESHYGGFSLFSYNYLFNKKYFKNNTLNELNNLKELLKSDVKGQ